MNGRKAKLARRAAERVTVGKLDKSYTGGGIDSKTGKKIPIRLANDCTRKIYQDIKTLPTSLLATWKQVDADYDRTMAKYA